jgi:CDP-diacylglycerol--glycerol-3-phosphate 3-phosphatidyltransferase
MVSVYDLKPRFQSLLRPLMGRLAAAGLTANGLTLLAVLGSILVGVIVGFGRGRPALLLLLPLWLLARMALNALDGMMARELGTKSTLGAVLNEVGDVVSDLSLYLPLALVRPDALWPVVAFAIAAVLTEFCGVLGQALGAGRQYQGPMGKSDRAFVVGALAAATALRPRIVEAWPWIFTVASALAGWTCLRRCQAALAAARASR